MVALVTFTVRYLCPVSYSSFNFMLEALLHTVSLFLFLSFSFFCISLSFPLFISLDHYLCSLFMPFSHSHNSLSLFSLSLSHSALFSLSIHIPCSHFQLCFCSLTYHSLCFFTFTLLPTSFLSFFLTLSLSLPSSLSNSPHKGKCVNNESV